MQTKRKNRIAAVLTALLLLSLCACGKQAAPQTSDTPRTFTLTVVDGQGTETEFEITSAAATVGDALLEQGLIAGEDGPYGLYVKTVNGLTVDYDTDGRYWAFYIGDDYASTGIEKTEIEDGGSYKLKVE